MTGAMQRNRRNRHLLLAIGWALLLALLAASHPVDGFDSGPELSPAMLATVALPAVDPAAPRGLVPLASASILPSAGSDTTPARAPPAAS